MANLYTYGGTVIPVLQSSDVLADKTIYHKGQEGSANLLNPAEIVEGYSITQYGTKNPGSEANRNYVVIPITAGHKYAVIDQGVTPTSATAVNVLMVFGTSDAVPVTGVSAVTSKARNTLDETQAITAPSGATHLFISWCKDPLFMVYDVTENGILTEWVTYKPAVAPSTEILPQIKENLIIEEKEDIAEALSGAETVEGVAEILSVSKILKNVPADLKIICIGDSLTQGDYGTTAEQKSGGKYTDIRDENYPYFFAKLLGLVNNVQVLNFGKSGTTPKTWYSNKWAEVSGDFAYSKNKRIIVPIMFGANGGFTDTIETDTASGDYTTYADTVVGWYCRIIEQIMELSNGMAEIIIFATPYVDPERSLTSYNNALTANPISKKIAEKYNLPFVDGWHESGISKLNTAVMQPVDGLHLGLTGYSKLGSFIASAILSKLSFAYVTSEIITE